MSSQKNIVVTGSTRGIGYGLALEFLKRGHNVCVVGRSQSAVDDAVKSLTATAPAGTKVIGTACDVGDIAQVQSVWDAAKSTFGRVDIWINNAGAINRMQTIGDLNPDDIKSVPRTNLVGSINGCQVALNGMKPQGSGAIYNFEGFGSDGTTQNGMSIYGATKRGLTYFTDSFIKETKGGPIIVGHMSPGMVTTDMLLAAKDEVTPERWKRMQWIYGILANDVETVTPWLVEGVLANTKHGARIAWLTKGKAMLRFFKALIIKPPVPRGLQSAA